MLGHPCRCAARDRPNKKAGDCVDDDGYEEERKADLDERREVEVRGGLGKLVGDDAGEGVAGAKSDLLISGWLPMTMVTAMVSPRRGRGRA